MTLATYPRDFIADTAGRPLDSGKIYVGVVNQDPQTFPVQVYWDAALTIPATQPLTIGSGYVMNAGARAQAFVAQSTFSMRVRDKNDVQVDYIADASNNAVLIAARGFISVKDYGATGDGVTSDLAAFNAAATAANGAMIWVPAGNYAIGSATSSGFWLLDPKAKIVGVADIGVATVSMLNQTSRLTGQMVRYGPGPSSATNTFAPTMRIGDTRGWLETGIRGSTESYATLPVISRGGGIAVTGASRTSDSPSPVNTAMSCIGGNFYAINDVTSATQMTAYGVYVEAQRKAGCGMIWGMEMDAVNFGPDTIDIKPSTALTYAAYTSGMVINSGGGHSSIFPCSVGLTFQYNGSTFKRGIVFNVGSLDGTTNEAVAMASGHRMAWYDSTGTLISYQDQANSDRLVDAAGAFYVTDSVRRKGGAGAATGNLDTIALATANGWTGAAWYQGSFTRTIQRSAFSGGNARFSYDINATNSGGTSAQISLNGLGDNTFGPITDNAISCGAASGRWSVVYAGTGAINTSDERAKHWLGGPTDADTRAAKRIQKELGWYQWADAMAEKGEDNARKHFGVRAQAIARILIDEGIETKQAIDFPNDIFVPEDQRPSFRSAFITFDTWDEEWQDEFEEIEETEQVEVVLTKRVKTGKKTKGGKPAYKTVKVPHTLDQPVKRSVPTGERTKTKNAGNRFGVRSDQLALYLISALAAD